MHCFGICVDRPLRGLYLEMSPLHPVLRLGNEYQLQANRNQSAYTVVLFWSTEKGAGMKLQQPDNADERQNTPPQDAQFLTTVRKKTSELTRRVDALHTKQEEVQQGQETILWQLRILNGLVS